MTDVVSASRPVLMGLGKGRPGHEYLRGLVQRDAPERTDEGLEGDGGAWECSF